MFLFCKWVSSLEDYSLNEEINIFIDSILNVSGDE